MDRLTRNSLVVEMDLIGIIQTRFAHQSFHAVKAEHLTPV